MKKLLAILLCLAAAAAAAPAWGAQPSNYVNNATGKYSPGYVPETSPGVPFGSSVPSTVTPLAPAQPALSVVTAATLTVPAGAREAFILCPQDILWRDDGTTVTSTVGTLLPALTPFPYTGSLSVISLESTSGAGTCAVDYYK